MIVNLKNKDKNMMHIFPKFTKYIVKLTQIESIAFKSTQSSEVLAFRSQAWSRIVFQCCSTAE